MKVLCLYHRDLDGYAALYAVWKRFGADPMVTEFYHIGVQYGEPLPDEAKNYDVVYIVDFAYSREVMDELAKCVELHVFDHHPQSAESLAGTDYGVHDYSVAGCLLTWNQLLSDTEPPFTINYADDYDRHVFLLPNSREVNARLLQLRPGDWEAWEEITYEVALTEGTIINRVINDTAKFFYKRKTLVTVADAFDPEKTYTVPVTNAPIYYNEASALGYNEYPDAPFVLVYRHDGERWIFSLRRANGSKDLSLNTLCGCFGGGGQHNASAFSLFGSIDPVVVTEILLGCWMLLKGNVPEGDVKEYARSTLALRLPFAACGKKL